MVGLSDSGTTVLHAEQKFGKARRITDFIKYKSGNEVLIVKGLF